MMNTAKYTFNLFKKKNGSNNIIQYFALNRILKYIKYKKSKRILEIGIGIGTIPFAIQEAKARGVFRHDFEYFGTEDDLFCIEAFKANIPGGGQFINHYLTLADVPVDKKYDFIIVDGKDALTGKIPQMLERGGVVIIEGGRSVQRNMVQESDRNYIKFSEVGFSFGRLGGLTVFFFEPTIIDRLILYKARILTAIKYRAVIFLKSTYNG